MTIECFGFSATTKSLKWIFAALVLLFMQLAYLFDFMHISEFALTSNSSPADNRAEQHLDINHTNGWETYNVSGAAIGGQLLPDPDTRSPSAAPMTPVPTYNESRLFEWEHIHPDELTTHFTPYELQSMDRNTSRRRCTQEPKRCCMGSYSTGGNSKWHHSSTCMSASHLPMKLRYSSHQQVFNMMDIFWRLPNNTRVLIMGDSVQQQVWNAMECDFLRSNLSVSSQQQVFLVPSRINFSLLDPRFSPMLSEFGNYSSSSLSYQYKSFLDTRSQFNHTYVGYLNGTATTHVVSFIFWQMYRPYLPLFSDFCNWADIVIYGWDLHYDLQLQDREWYRDIGDGILNLTSACLRRRQHAAAAARRHPIFIWRESSTQHYGRIGGYWTDVYVGANHDAILAEYRQQMSVTLNDSAVLSNTATWLRLYDGDQFLHHYNHCLPLNFYGNESHERFMWRERVMDYVNHGLNQSSSINVEIVYPNKRDFKLRHDKNDTIYYIPFKQVTDPLWDMHRDSECTHLCFTPHLYSFIWDALWSIIDKNL